ncbi:STAS domain-containing protein [Rhodococcoides fascians]|uniref:STAS domain-containing protein n=1 Tax=Rhodococcoides fascians TaxID=1828 RepID=UPI0036705F91
MVFLRSVHSDPESIRLSFCGPDNPEDGAFALSVDELVGGPVVIRIVGSIDRSAIPVIGECVSEAIVCGRSLVVDLLDVEFVDPAVVSVLSAAALRLAAHRCRAIVACTPELQRQLDPSGVHLGTECVRSVADAVRSAVKPARSEQVSEFLHRRDACAVGVTGSSAPCTIVAAVYLAVVVGDHSGDSAR